ncbi:hypothetical protein MHYP_G00168190 [Metynnis hypsauchen]
MLHRLVELLSTRQERAESPLEGCEWSSMLEALLSESLERVIEELGRFEVFAVCLVFLCCFLSESERQRQKEKPTFPPPVVFYQRAALHRPLELRRLSSQAQTAGVMRASRRGKEFQQRCQSNIL